VALGQIFLRVLRFSPVSIIPLWISLLIYHLGLYNRHVGGRSSETSSHSIDMNNNSNKDANNSAARQEIRRLFPFFFEPRQFCRVHTSSTLAPILSQMIPLHAII
jgi:hypothetical protein